MSDEAPDLVQLIDDLRRAGLPIPDDANPVQVLAALLAARETPDNTWQGFPFVVGGDLPVVLIEQMMEEEILPKFRKQVEEGGGLAPVGFVFARNAPEMPHKKAPDGQARHLVLGSKPNVDFDGDQKDDFSRALKLLAWKTDAAAVVFASEAWILMAEAPEVIQEYTGRLNEHPGHKEIVMVHWERDVGEGAYYRAEIHRKEDGSVDRLGDWEKETHYVRLSGRFTNILLQNSVGAP